MTGTSCTNCHAGHLAVYCTRRHGDKVTRYFACWLCGARPENNKVVTDAPPQSSRKRVY